MRVTLPVSEPSRVLLAGDWHGSRSAAGRAITAACDAGADVVVQLGHFGLWPGRPGRDYLDAVETYASRLDVEVLWIDGNHEDFDDPRLSDRNLDPGTGLHPFGDHVHHLPRGARWTWRGVRFTAVGGGTSLDRGSRVPGRSWWPQEELTEGQARRIAGQGGTDVLLSHDCPSGVDIPGIAHRTRDGSEVWPREELERAWDHRDRLGDLTRSLRPTHVVHGHVHLRYEAEALLADGLRTRVVGLADDAAGVEANVLLVDLDLLAADVRARRAGEVG